MLYPTHFMSPKPCLKLNHGNKIQKPVWKWIKAIKPLNLKIQNLNEIKTNPKIIHDTILQKKARWTINQQIVKLELIKFSQTKTHPITFQQKFLNIQNNFPDHHYIYTDGSKQRMKIDCAAILQNQELLQHLPNESSF